MGCQMADIRKAGNRDPIRNGAAWKTSPYPTRLVLTVGSVRRASRVSLTAILRSAATTPSSRFLVRTGAHEQCALVSESRKPLDIGVTPRSRVACRRGTDGMREATMIRYRIEETINRPMEEVFPYLAIRRSTQVVAGERRPGRPARRDPGRHHGAREDEGRLRMAPFSWEVTEYQPGTRFAFHTIEGPMSWEGSYAVAAGDERRDAGHRLGQAGPQGLAAAARAVHGRRDPARRGRGARGSRLSSRDRRDRTPGTERVCLLLADLSGYTAYLANSEPDHAPALAGDLVETVVRQLRPTFRLEKLEGDAAFLVAPLEGWTGRCCWMPSTRPTTHSGVACRA